MIEILILTLFYLVPVAGATYTSFKLLYSFLKSLQNKRKSGLANIVDFLKPIGMALVSIWGFIMISFMALMIFFPTIEIPQNIRIIGIIIFVPYIMVAGVLYGLSRAVASGAGSVTGILGSVSDMISIKETNNKKKHNE